MLGFIRVVAALAAVLVPSSIRAQDLKVTLLGTGSPEPILQRFGPSTLVEAGPEKFLFDVGRGASQRLWQLGLPLRAVTGVFITHLHSDHVVGLPDVWLTGWTAPPYGRRVAPFRVWGPAGTRAMMASLETAFVGDIRIRMDDERLPKEGVAVVAEDITEGVVYERNGVRVTAFTVDHGPAIKPAFGYRVDYAGRSVVIAGDTRFTENLVRFARGADVLVHPMALAAPGSPMEPTVRLHFATPEEAGTVFTRASPKLAVYNHIILLGDPPPTLAQIVARTRTTYAGPLHIGNDLMVLDIGDQVTVHTAVP